MKETQRTYDAAIVGGGLAGLTLAIQLARAGYAVVLFEKEIYPFHKVCGEYISFESWNFLQDLGLPLSDWNLPIIRRLQVSSPGGRALEQDLPLGGFGISRYKLDAALAELARSMGVDIRENSKVTHVEFQSRDFIVQAGETRIRALVVCGCFGKRSNLDVKWKRLFIRKKRSKLNNWIAVKYHVSLTGTPGLIALHNFKNGYCGLSEVEDGRYCLCYLTTAGNLERAGHSIQVMEQTILDKNPFLHNIFSKATPLYDQPLTISQISFEKKSRVEEHILLIGDAAGLITPLCGNGMSMAMHGSKIAFECVDAFLKKEIARHEMEQQYADRWNRNFRSRLRTGRMIQLFFGSEWLSDLLVRGLKPFPRIVQWLISKTHGEPF